MLTYYCICLRRAKGEALRNILRLTRTRYQGGRDLTTTRHRGMACFLHTWRLGSSLLVESWVIVHDSIPNKSYNVPRSQATSVTVQDLCCQSRLVETFSSQKILARDRKARQRKVSSINLVRLDQKTCTIPASSSSARFMKKEGDQNRSHCEIDIKRTRRKEER